MNEVATFIPLVARWRAHAVSDSAQGADGTAELARSAFANLCAAAWEHDPDPASMPVHEFDRPEPRGQAYKAVYGYDAEAREQRSCAGAACLTYEIPPAAMDSEAQAQYTLTDDEEIVEDKAYYTRSGSGTELDPYVYSEVADPVAESLGNYFELLYPEGEANVLRITVPVAVDRYCDKGVVVYGLLSASPDPAPFGNVVSAAQSGIAWFRTDMQTGPDGSQLAPNKRLGESGSAVFVFNGPQSPERYLHVYLMMADYLGVRGGWVEGSGMFADEAGVAVSFSRPVEVAEWPADERRTVLSLGVPGNGLSIDDALAALPRVRLWANWAVTPDAAAFAGLDAADWDAKAANLLSFIFGAAPLYASTPTILSASASVAVKLGKKGVAALEAGATTKAAFCALVAHGLTRGRTFRGIRFENPVNPGNGETVMPYRLLVYGISQYLSFANPGNAVGAGEGEGASPGPARSSSIIPWWGDVMGKAFRAGKAETICCLSSPASNSGDYTAEAPVTPLAAVDADGEVSSVAFDRPWTSGEISSVVVALVPNGIPAAASSEDDHTASVLGTVSVMLPNTGVSAAVTSSDITQAFSNVTVRTWASFTPDTGTVPGWLKANGIIPSWHYDVSVDKYAWNSTDSRSVDNVITPLDLRIAFSLVVAGETYSFDASFRSSVSLNWVFRNAEERTAECGGFGMITSSVWGTSTSGRTLRATVAFQVVVFAMTGYSQTGTSPWRTFISADACGRPTGSTVKVTTEHPDSNGGKQLYYDAAGASGTIYVGKVYDWSDYSLGTVGGSADETLAVSFSIDSKQYSAQIVSAAPATISVYAKSHSGAQSGYDRTQYAAVSLTLPAKDFYAVFTAGDGSRVRALLQLPARSYTSEPQGGGDNYYVHAKNVAAGQSTAIQLYPAATATANVSETGATQEIDLGAVSLYE